MALQIGSSPPVIEGLPPTLPPGYSLALYQVAPDFQPQGSEIVDIPAVDFVAPGFISADMLGGVIGTAAPLIASGGQNIEGYWLYRGPSIAAEIPETVEIFGIVYVLPFGGVQIGTFDQYRLYMLLGNPGQVQVMQAARGQAVGGGITAWGIAATGFVMVGLMIVGAGIVMAWQGKIPWNDIAAPLKGMMPGTQLGEAITDFSWPMFALGFAIVAFSTLGPSLKDLGASVGFQRAGFGAGVGLGRAPALPR